MFKLAETDWHKELDALSDSGDSEILLVSPFIKLATVNRLLRHKPPAVRVLTRFDLKGFAQRVSDIRAIRRLLDSGAAVRGVKHLHAKVYQSADRAVVTSANLTEAALFRNREFGVITDDPAFVAECKRYFERIWKLAATLSSSKLSQWEDRVTQVGHVTIASKSYHDLPDFGADLRLSPDLPIPTVAQLNPPSQWFLKFLGEAHRREPHTFPVIAELKRAGCHWAVGYPKGRRPRNVSTGDIMLMGRLVEHPDDTMIFGRGIAKQHEQTLDDATEAEKRAPQRDWKRKWPHYVRIKDAEFLNGTMGDGASLREMMDALGPNAFVTTQHNAKAGSGNTNPRRAFSQAPSVRLSKEGFEWLNSRLDVAFSSHGRIREETIAALDWPPGSRW